MWVLGSAVAVLHQESCRILRNAAEDAGNHVLELVLGEGSLLEEQPVEGQGAERFGAEVEVSLCVEVAAVVGEAEGGSN